DHPPPRHRNTRYHKAYSESGATPHELVKVARPYSPAPNTAPPIHPQVHGQTAGRAPPACPFSRPPAANCGHSSHMPTLTPRSAFALVSLMIAARSSKLAMPVRSRSPAPRLLPGQTMTPPGHGKGRRLLSRH
ncbi:MAG: hypothetical protein ACREQ5_20250, partial [Candidatus Dormibacteria bacterium]